MSELTLSEQVSIGTPGSGKWTLAFKSDGVYIVDDVGNETGPLVQQSLTDTLYQPIGIINTRYIISPSVASNNLTVAIKYIDGNDASASHPIPFRVGNTEYTLSAAVSYTKNAGTNLCNAGSAEMKANDIDFFVY